MPASNIIDATLLEILEVSLPHSIDAAGRSLQGFQLPDYTSPPLPAALEATPDPWDDDAVQAGRNLDAAGLCVGDTANYTACQITFAPEEDDESDVGVVFYGGALVDPRGYSPLAQILSTDFGLPVVVPIFDADSAFKFGTCESGRLIQAQKSFPDVERWVLAGHSFGGLVAFNDAWQMVERNSTEDIGGVALLGSYLRNDLGCGNVDFSTEEWSWLPFASISGSEDTIVNRTNFEKGQELLPTGPLSNITIVEGGNHGFFGMYDYSERKELLGQIDGNATITHEEQIRISAGIIANLAKDAMKIGVADEGTDAEEEGIDAKEEGTDAEEEGIDAEEEGTYAKDEGIDAEEEGTDAEEEGTDAKEEGTVQPESSGGALTRSLFLSTMMSGAIAVVSASIL